MRNIAAYNISHNAMCLSNYPLFIVEISMVELSHELSVAVCMQI